MVERLSHHLAYRLISGEQTDPVKGGGEIELLLDFARDEAVTQFADRLKRMFVGHGYLVIADIDAERERFLEDDCMDGQLELETNLVAQDGADA